MMGVLKLCWNDVCNMTLAQLQRIYESCIMSDWNHTATTNHQVNCLTTVVGHFGSKGKVKLPSVEEFHPFIETKEKRVDDGVIGQLNTPEQHKAIHKMLVANGFASSKPYIKKGK